MRNHSFILKRTFFPHGIECFWYPFHQHLEIADADQSWYHVCFQVYGPVCRFAIGPSQSASSWMLSACIIWLPMAQVRFSFGLRQNLLTPGHMCFYFICFSRSCSIIPLSDSRISQYFKISFLNSSVSGAATSNNLSKTFQYDSMPVLLMNRLMLIVSCYWGQSV